MEKTFLLSSIGWKWTNLVKIFHQQIFLLLGIALALGLIGALLSKKLKVPQVVGYILIGVLIGVSGFNLITARVAENLDILSQLALALIGFTIGGKLEYAHLKKLGRSITTITFFESLGAFFLVLISVLFLTKSLPAALIFGALASATAPAATVDVLWEYHSEGPLTTTLFAVVGADDAAALIIYGFASSIARTIIKGGQQNVPLINSLTAPLVEIISSILIGFVAALLLFVLTKKMSERGQILISSLAAVFVCAGIATTLHLSLILTTLVLGVSFVNLRGSNKKLFDELMEITPPIYLIFFVLVGARLQISLLPKLGLLGLVYIAMRVFGKSTGCYVGALASGAPETVRKYLGFGLLSQAGVAIGLALDAFHTFANYGEQGAYLGLLAINVIAATTFIFQILGPPLTKYAIVKAGEVPEEYLE